MKKLLCTTLLGLSATLAMTQIATKDNCYHVMAKDPDGQDVTLFLDMKSGQVVNPE